MKRHIIRLNAPRTWSILRKQHKYIMRPNPGSQSFKFGIALGVLLREYLKIAKDRREIRTILLHKEVLVNGVKQKDRFKMVGLFDVLEFPSQKTAYRLIMSKTKKLLLTPIPAKEANLTISKVRGKTLLKKGRIQLNLWDGRNILIDTKKAKEYATGDCLILELPKNEVKETFKMEKGNHIVLIEGKHTGKTGTIESVSQNKIIFKDTAGQVIETAKPYAIVVGKKHSVLTVTEA